ncbi:LAGLIDADG family homing endonuclease [Halorubrum sp. 2020YC2]|uniref:LAGLIDADG family homing endonuclease n=1 Tax=Halorubrum sp. 2020YC2 TaxID=2836432 RepID=UPI001BEAF32A|nr:LAGLIDADG family homing endonuclease [Halorubrum sp. 2020YC2]QWC18953.1 ATP-binding protein [Halorubrum sp. 2020YC2]
MAQAGTQDLTERFIQFYRNYYREEIGTLAQRYPNEQRSLYVSYDDLFQFDRDLAEDFLNKPEQMREYAEEALRLYDLPADVSLGRAHVRIEDLPESVDIRGIRVHDDHISKLVSVQGIVRKATDVRPKVTEAAFECQRCGTMTYIPQSDGGFQEPHECQGCERQGPFRVNFDQSEFVDSQKLRIQESPEGLRGGETPQSLDVDIVDDITGEVSPGDHVTCVGVLHIEQVEQGNEKSAIFDLYMDGVSIAIEDEEFEDMDITEADKRDIIELSERDDIYEAMVGSIAPAIYGYEEEKLAMILQLFSGVTKHLPDGSRIRGDLHMLLIGDPGTGKSQMISYVENIAPRSVYTSGKGSSAAGLCVTGDTKIHTSDGFLPIREIATEYHPEPVESETSADAEHDLYTFDRASGRIELTESSHAWRMPEKPCRRIETAHGKNLEASVNTPVLVCGENGIEWRPISDVETGDHVGVPKYVDIDRSSPPVREYIELTEEKIKPTDESIEVLRTELIEEFGTLRDAAAELGLSEDFVYDTLSNRHIPLDKLNTVLTATGTGIGEIDIDHVMIHHGEEVTIPDEFDADLLYLIGLVFGDGDVMVSRRGGNRGRVRISNSDEELLERAANIFETKFGKSVDIEYQDDRVPCVRLHSATVARFFSNVGVESPKDDIALDPNLTTAEHADAFLRGLFDADGSVCGRDNGGSSVQFSTVCGELAEQVQLMLETYGVRSRMRERDRRGTYERADGHEIESTSIQTHLAIYGKELDLFADQVGFRSTEKSAALDEIVHDAPRRGELLPVGSTLARTDGGAGRYWQNLNRGDDPSRERTLSMIDDLDLGAVGSVVEEVAKANLVWDEVVDAENTGEKEVFDLTVPDTHNFLGNGLVTHNTAAAVRDDFGDGQQWSLEAGALVLADKGIAAVDELDKMDSSDRSAMHEGLEQQKISVSKAGINATLKARCSLLGAANPKYGRFDQYEPIGEQIDLEPALISRFDLIFTVTDSPDPEHDSRLAQHIIKTNYAGELNTQREELASSEFTSEQVAEVTEEVAPEIDAELLRKYVAHAKRSCYPTMTDEAKEVIEEFYVDLRSKGADEDAPVPVTARKLEAMVRLSEASARVRLSDTVEREDADRATDIVESCLKDIGVDPETGQFDADVVETGTSKSQRDRIKNIKGLIADIEEEYQEGAPVDEVLDRAGEIGMDPGKAEQEIEKLRTKGEVYEPKQGHLRTT